MGPDELGAGGHGDWGWLRDHEETDPSRYWGLTEDGGTGWLRGAGNGIRSLSLQGVPAPIQLQGGGLSGSWVGSETQELSSLGGAGCIQAPGP